MVGVAQSVYFSYRSLSNVQGGTVYCYQHCSSIYLCTFSWKKRKRPLQIPSLYFTYIVCMLSPPIYMSAMHRAYMTFIVEGKCSWQLLKKCSAFFDTGDVLWTLYQSIPALQVRRLLQPLIVGFLLFCIEDRDVMNSVDYMWQSQSAYLRLEPQVQILT